MKRWQIEYDKPVKKTMRKIDKKTRESVVNYMEERVATLESPRLLGKALTGKYSGYWRYRVGDCRVICDIIDKRLVVLVVEVGDRKDIYN